MARSRTCSRRSRRPARVAMRSTCRSRKVWARGSSGASCAARDTRFAHRRSAVPRARRWAPTQPSCSTAPRCSGASPGPPGHHPAQPPHAGGHAGCDACVCAHALADHRDLSSRTLRPERHPRRRQLYRLLARGYQRWVCVRTTTATPSPRASTSPATHRGRAQRDAPPAVASGQPWPRARRTGAPARGHPGPHDRSAGEQKEHRLIVEALPRLIARTPAGVRVGRRRTASRAAGGSLSAERSGAARAAARWSRTFPSCSPRPTCSCCRVAMREGRLRPSRRLCTPASGAGLGRGRVHRDRSGSARGSGVRARRRGDLVA